jgi:hypothetical protein
VITHTSRHCEGSLLPWPFTLFIADETSNRLVGTATLLVERKFIHDCGMVRAAARGVTTNSLASTARLSFFCLCAANKT